MLTRNLINTNYQRCIFISAITKWSVSLFSKSSFFVLSRWDLMRDRFYLQKRQTLKIPFWRICVSATDQKGTVIRKTKCYRAKDYLVFGSWLVLHSWCNEKTLKFGQYLKQKASEVPYQRQGWEHLTMLPESTPIPVRYKDFFWYWQQHAMYKSLSWVRDWCQLILKECCCEEVHWSHLGTFLQHFFLSF